MSSSRPTDAPFGLIEDSLKACDIHKIKSLLRANELPINHDARGHLWPALCFGSADTIGDDETFKMYAAKFANGEFYLNMACNGMQVYPILLCCVYLKKIVALLPSSSRVGVQNLIHWSDLLKLVLQYLICH